MRGNTITLALESRIDRKFQLFPAIRLSVASNPSLGIGDGCQMEKRGTSDVEVLLVSNVPAFISGTRLSPIAVSEHDA
jgi:hypothetical protein